MSGLFGLWRMDERPVRPDELAPLRTALDYRAPGGVALWAEDSIALARLLPPCPPTPPPATPPRSEGGVVLAYDVQLDNREALAQELGLASRGGETSDEELLLCAYRAWGRAIPEHLVGAFAFAAWDTGRRELLCVRDHFGIKPLYYCLLPHRLFAFSSDIGGLLALPEIAGDVDEEEIARHLLVPIGDDSAATYYREIRRVRPAHALMVSPEGIEERRYWSPDTSRELKLGSVEEYAEAFRECFVEAVRCRMPRSGPVASMLSGGLDSSAITCVAARLGRGAACSDVHTLSAVYPTATASDETPYIDEVLKGCDATAHPLEGDGVDPLEAIRDAMRFVGGSIWRTNLYLNWYLYGIGSDTGATVILDGYDGDVTVSHGRGLLGELALGGRWVELVRTSWAYSRRMGEPPLEQLLPLVQFGLRRRGIRVPGRSGGQHRVRFGGIPVRSGFAEEVLQDGTTSHDPVTTERQAHARQVTSQRLTEPLGWLEACGAGRGVDVRFPFFDLRLVELCISFPPEQKLCDGWTRYVMRRAMEGILPPRIQWRPDKASLRAGWAHALRTHERGRLSAVLREKDAVIDRYLDRRLLEGQLDHFLAARSTAAEDLALWRALSLALWLPD